MNARKIFAVYILASKKYGTLYVGVTSNLPGRMLQHRHGTYDGFTKKYGAIKLVYFETTENPIAAITREKQIKRWRRDYKINLIERENPNWNDLSIGLLKS